MNAAQKLHDLGQSLWLDNITRNLLKTGVLRRYIDELSVTGLTSNPTIFDHAIKNSSDYDDAIKGKLAEGKSGEKLFFELALGGRAVLSAYRQVAFDPHHRDCGAIPSGPLLPLSRHPGGASTPEHPDAPHPAG